MSFDLVIVAVGVLVATVLSVLANWLSPAPAWMTRPRIVAAIVFLVVVTIAVQMVTPVHGSGTDTEVPNGAAPAGNPKLVPPNTPAACTNDYSGDGSPRLVSTSASAGLVNIQNGYRVSFPELTWAGILLEIPSSTCDYVVELDARLVNTSSGSDGPGWGYGVGVCDRWDGHQPGGFIVQYSLISNNDQPATNSGRFSMPYVNDGRRIPFQADGNSHHWIVSLRGGSVTVSLDWGEPLGPFPATRTASGISLERSLPDNCRGAGAFLRVLATTADFTNITVHGIA